GVAAVGSTSSFPLRGTQENSLFVKLHGEAIDRAHPMGARQRFVSPGFFASAGTRLIQGRDFGREDRLDTTPVAIVNSTFAKRYLAGRNAIGVQFAASYPEPDPRNEVTVVGVVEDVRQKSLSDEAEPAFYSSLTQVPVRRQTMVVSTSRADITPLETAIRDEVRKVDPQIALEFELASEVVAATI